MKKNTKKILTLSVLGMFMLMFAMSFVVAGGNDVGTTGEQKGLIPTLWNAFFGGMGGDTSFGQMLEEKFGIVGAGESDYAALISFFLLIFIVGLLVYDIADMLPFFSKPWMKTSFSIAFSVLAFMLFDMNQIEYLTSTYQAAGLAMVAIIPFIVIAAFVWKLDQKAQDETKPTYGMFGSAIWVGFGIYLILKLVKLNQEMILKNLGDSPIYTAYLILTLFALGAVFMHSKVYAWFHKKTKKKLRKAGVKKGEQNQVRVLRNRIQEVQDAMRNPENASNIDELESLQKEKDSLEKAIGVLEG